MTNTITMRDRAWILRAPAARRPFEHVFSTRPPSAEPIFGWPSSAWLRLGAVLAIYQGRGSLTAST